MKFIAVPILILLIMTQTFSKWVMIADYNINRDYIANNLCENKAKPALKCKGKCQLMKKMAAEENQDKNQGSQNTGKEKISELLYFEKITTADFNDCLQNSIAFPDYCLTPYSSPYFSIFHPPA
jgi:hypothetical protein